MRTVSIVGARPQFIKSAPLLRALLAAEQETYLIHTGQHYDPLMSDIFFEQLSIPKPNVNLEVGSGTANHQIGEMLLRLEEAIDQFRPDWVIVYGDTNSTLAGALSATKLGIPLVHVEAGLRSYNWEMPEEQNRVLTDHCSTIKICPTVVAVENLRKEGVVKGVHLAGDTMVDALNFFLDQALLKSSILRDLSLSKAGYCLATIHRAGNTSRSEDVLDLLETFNASGETVIFPVHPRTRNLIPKTFPSNKVKLIEPVSYLDMLILEKNARAILTDSGGVQKEAFLLKVPCITLRGETEWVETVEEKCNVLVGTDRQRILTALKQAKWPSTQTKTIYGDGHASERIVKILSETL